MRDNLKSTTKIFACLFLLTLFAYVLYSDPLNVRFGDCAAYCEARGQQGLVVSYECRCAGELEADDE